MSTRYAISINYADNCTNRVLEPHRRDRSVVLREAGSKLTKCPRLR